MDTVNKIADVDKYIKSWAFEPEKYSDIKEENLSITYLNSKIEVLVKEILDNQSMPMEYQTAYFKMIFLKEKLAKDFPLFSELSETKKQALKKIFQDKKCLAAPDFQLSVMVPQQIKIYNPIAQLRKYIKNKILRKKNGK